MAYLQIAINSCLGQRMILAAADADEEGFKALDETLFTIQNIASLSRANFLHTVVTLPFFYLATSPLQSKNCLNGILMRNTFSITKVPLQQNVRYFV